MTEKKKSKTSIYISDGLKKREFSLIFQSLSQRSLTLNEISRTTGLSYGNVYISVGLAEKEELILKTYNKKDRNNLYSLSQKGEKVQ